MNDITQTMLVIRHIVPTYYNSMASQPGDCRLAQMSEWVRNVNVHTHDSPTLFSKIMRNIW